MVLFVHNADVLTFIYEWRLYWCVSIIRLFPSFFYHGGTTFSHLQPKVTVIQLYLLDHIRRQHNQIWKCLWGFQVYKKRVKLGRTMHSASILNLKPYLIINSKTVNLSNVSTSIKRIKFFMAWMLTKNQCEKLLRSLIAVLLLSCVSEVCTWRLWIMDKSCDIYNP